MKNNCVICGKIYDALRANQKTCSEECRYEYAKYCTEMNKRKGKFAKKNAKKSSDNLTAVARKAREAGMSYGEYVSKMM